MTPDPRPVATIALSLLAAMPLFAQQPAPGQSAAPATAAAAPEWPHTVTTANGTATVYQPQVISWPERRTLNTRGVVGVTPAGAKQATLGTVEMAFSTDVDLAGRTVVLTEPRLVSARFPALDAARSAQLEQRIREIATGLGVKRVPLALVTKSLAEQADKPPAIAIDNTPPRIFASARPASLVVYDGEPVLAPILGTALSFVVNTNWDVFRDAGSATWFLLVNGGWLAAPDAKGPWAPAGTLPAAFAALPANENFRDVKAQIPDGATARPTHRRCSRRPRPRRSSSRRVRRSGRRFPAPRSSTRRTATRRCSAT